MGIYLPNMEMPKGFEMIVVFSDGTVHKCLPGMREYIEKGTAAPVPAHGRLGDLDEIERYKERLVVDADKIEKEIRYVVDTKYIKEAPTIIPAEEGE